MASRNTWRGNNPRALIFEALQGAPEGMSSRELQVHVPTVGMKARANTLYQLKKAGYLLQDAGDGGDERDRRYRVNPEKPLPEIAHKLGDADTSSKQDRSAHGADEGPAEGAAAAPDARAVHLGGLAAELASLLIDSELGLSSEQLADATGTTLEAVDEALLPAVEDRKLITCVVVKGGRRFLHYRRSSAGIASYDWRRQCEATWTNRRATMQAAWAQSRKDLAQPVSTVDTEPAPRPAATPATEEPPAPAPAPAPDVAENLHELLAQAAASPRAIGPSSPEFDCSLNLRHELTIQHQGKRLTLPAPQTFELMAYLCSAPMSLLGFGARS